jgi:putative transposase
MPRPKAILQSTYPYNLSARCANRERFPIPLDEVWAILCEELYMARMLHDLRVHSLVLMSNHFHLIASTPLANISEAMRRFMEMSSKRISARAGRSNQIWGRRHFKSVLGGSAYYLNAYKYNYFNPVKAGITERCEDYRFSTLAGLLGVERLLLPLEEDQLLMADAEEVLRWLNRRPCPKALEAVRAALRKGHFEHVKCPSSRKPMIGEGDVI